MGILQNRQQRSLFRAKVRRWEFELMARAINQVVDKAQMGKLKILEFGCGACEGSQYLCQLGTLVATDIYKDPLLNLPPSVEFAIADIHETDFKEQEFDLLISSQVIEHLENPTRAFREMKRIARENAYYAFSIPTATWLVLAIPAKVFKKIENVLTRIRGCIRPPQSNEARHRNPDCVSSKNPRHVKKGWLRRWGLGGHGCYPRFIECFKAFRVGNWRRVLISNGFEILTETPLLCRGDSYFSLFPPNHFLARLGLASSYLFICRKAEDHE